MNYKKIISYAALSLYACTYISSVKAIETNTKYKREDYVKKMPKEYEFKSATIIRINDAIYEYMLDVSLREPQPMRRLREETAKDSQSIMQSPVDQGQFMALMVKLTNAKNILEIGTFTGYSTLWMASALPENGKIITCDVSPQWTSIGEKYWKEAGVRDKIDLRIGPAENTLNQLIEDKTQEQFDIVFIDADKSNQSLYYEKSLKLLRPGGLIILDNVLWQGKVVDHSFDDVDTKSIRTLNAQLKDDSRVDISMLALGDGVTLIRKR